MQNQCDGCKMNWPLDEEYGTVHRSPSSDDDDGVTLLGCTNKEKYAVRMVREVRLQEGPYSIP